MAIGILQAIVERKTIVHQVHHDLESFVWVMCYSINRRLVLDSNRLSADERADLHKFFHGNFGRMDMDSIAVTRQALQPLRFPHRFPNLLSEPMTSLYDSLYDHLQLSVLRKDPVFLTHDVLLTEFDRIIHIISNTL
jgi:hypothetical protein